jgi:hypothetical protein
MCRLFFSFVYGIQELGSLAANELKLILLLPPQTLGPVSTPPVYCVTARLTGGGAGGIGSIWMATMTSKEMVDTRDPHRTTFRIRGIPATCNRPELSRMLLKALNLTDGSSLRIRSFSSDTSLPGEASQRTAVVSFGIKTQWPSLDYEELQVDGVTLTCDGTFLGFTPLSPVESDDQSIIE